MIQECNDFCQTIVQLTLQNLVNYLIMSTLNFRKNKLNLILFWIVAFVGFNGSILKAYGITSIIPMDTTEIDTALFLCSLNDTLFFEGQAYTETGVYDVFIDGPADNDTLIFLELILSTETFSVSPLDTTVCFGETVIASIIDSAGNPVTTGNMIQWENNVSTDCDTCFSTSFSGLNNLDYSVLYEDIYGCFHEISGAYFFENVGCTLDQVIMADIFTPNGDQVNDSFGILEDYKFEKLKSMEIYNRWGEQVFLISDDADLEGFWDGNIIKENETVPAPMDVYFYRVGVYCPSFDSNKVRYILGELTLIR